MKCISIRQPWAWLIVRPDLAAEARLAAMYEREIKTIENRCWPTSYRGPILIHAAKGMTRAEYDEANDPLWASGGPTIELPPMADLQRGGIVGRATLVDCIAPTMANSWWHVPGQFGLLLNGIEPLPFTPAKGALGIFEMPWPIQGACPC